MSTTETPSIVVVGAGAAGLMAAAVLSEKFAVTIVEARERTGGRIHSRPDLMPCPIEQGAEFIHGNPKITTSLLAKAGVTPITQSGRSYHYYLGEFVRRDQPNAEWVLFMETLRRLERDITIGQLLDEKFSGAKYASLRDEVAGLAAGYDAADLTRASAFALREEWTRQDDEHQLRIPSGYVSLIRHLEETFLARNGRIELSAAVSQITWRRGGVQLETTKGKVFAGTKCVITVPLGVLKSGKPVFSPPIPSYKQAFEKLGFGGVIKFFFYFEPVFWTSTVMGRFPNAAFIFSDARVPTWWTQAPETTPLLTGWMGGPATFTERNTEDLYEQGVKSLQYLLGCSRTQLEKNIQQWYISDWVRDPFALGAYSYMTVDSNDALALIRSPVEDTLYFAGEAFYNGPAIGTVEAALSSGQNAATEILT